MLMGVMCNILSCCQIVHTIYKVSGTRKIFFLLYQILNIQGKKSKTLLVAPLKDSLAKPCYKSLPLKVAGYFWMSKSKSRMQISITAAKVTVATKAGIGTAAGIIPAILQPIK